METLFVGRQRIEPEELSSTNSFALDLFQKGLVREGALILTRNQTAGRGQRGNTWESEPGKNLTVSFVLTPSFLKPSEQFVLSQVVSLAIAGMVGQCLSETAKQVRIKWPNDIYVEEKKVAGILIENVLRNESIQGSVVGIGLNVNQRTFRDPRAISLSALENKDFDLEECINGLCSSLEARYLQLKAGKTELLHKDYLQLLYRRNELKPYSDEYGRFNGIIEGVTLQGRLKLRREDGLEKQYDLKEIRFEDEVPGRQVF